MELDEESSELLRFLRSSQSSLRTAVSRGLKVESPPSKVEMNNALMHLELSSSAGTIEVAALQQITFNIDPRVLDSMIHDQGRSTQVSSSSLDLTSILDKYVLKWMGEDAVDGLCFHSPRAQLESRGRVGRFSRSAKVQKLPASRSSSELSAHQTAPSGVIAH